MLLELQISNFAIIDNQTITFAEGLNVLSGETGAGKSIILEALKLILGARANSEFVRSGEDFLEVTALFDLSALSESKKRNLPDIIDGEESQIVLNRQISKSGRGKVYVNGRLSTVSLLAEIAEKMISICSQNQSLKLNEPSYHRELIDGYGGHELLLKNYQSIFFKWKALRDKYFEAEARSKTGALRRAELEFLVEELSKLGLEAELRERLENEISKLSNGEKRLKLCQEIGDLFDAEEGILAQLQQINSKISELERYDQSLGKISAAFDSASNELNEFERGLSKYASSIELDQEALEDSRDRLSDLAKIERKYKKDASGLLLILEEAEHELSLLSDGENLEKLQIEIEEVETELKVAAEKLTKARQKASKSLVKQVESELSELNMNEARLSVSQESTSFTEFGADSIELLISTNKGEEAKPIRQIASGGELSRITLVLKKVLRDKSGVNVLVFDEVDTGVSGSVARAVGEKLKALAHDSQVLCITHLPQVASMADNHLLVQKLVSDRTRVSISHLNPEQRVEEIARMLAGYKVTEASRATARELIASNS